MKNKTDEVDGIKSVYKWICIAKLVQLFITSLPDLLCLDNYNEVMSEFSSLHNILETIFISVKSMLYNVKFEQKDNTNNINNIKKTNPIRTILFEWIVFLRSIAHILYRLMPNDIDLPVNDYHIWNVGVCQSVELLENEILVRHIHALGLTSLLVNVLYTFIKT